MLTRNYQEDFFTIRASLPYNKKALPMVRRAYNMMSIRKQYLTYLSRRRRDGVGTLSRL
jgi:hypothetical protein